ncbi:hypothetical protein C5Y96_15000 [Blastopirellula marina]|uniref:Protein kinase domain-containing protein n=1 Tax=Blastopirellula marina TaxID=124 RepID=A0A2S8FFR1_9BACT|nr:MULTISPECIES: protein kinase [Pirellulaceae]PQO30764.1 hypothetical protein C5Y96_15000 [Blastopirellula marina]RCS50901.1 hypothetical protein DTL36_15010 [Bremerella cremea]
MPDLADYAHLLPADLTLGERLQGTGVYGDVFRVEQASSSSIPLVVRFISTKDIGDQYHEPLAQRLELLSRGAMPHVSHIVRYGSQDNLLWVITDQYRSRLWDKLHPHEPALVADVERIFLQMVSGLETLHDLGISHGDMRSKNVFLSARGENEIAWVGDAAIGCFSWWTGSKILENDSLRYAIPGQEASSAGKPDFNHDLYALGLIGCELVLGHSFDRSSLEAIDKQLKNSNASYALRQLIVLLLRRGASKEPYRCGAVRSAWQDQMARQRQRSTNMLRVALAVMLLSIISLVWVEWLTHQTNLSLEAQLRDQLDAQTKLADKVGELEDQVRHLRQNPPQEPSVSPAADTTNNTEPSEAQKRWQEVVQKAENNASDKTATASDIWKAYAELKSSSDPKVSMFPGEVRGWSDSLRDRIMNDFYRTRRDDRLARLLNDYARAPWDHNAKEAVDARIDTLDQARDEWQLWADKSFSKSEVYEQLSLITNQSENEILAGWLKDLSSTKQPWNIRLIQGEAEEGWGKYRVVRIYVDGHQQGNRYNNTWKEETHHEYNPKNASNTMPFAWEPGQTFGLSLEQNGYAYNANMIYNAPFDGALALWKANAAGKTQNGLSVLKFQILNCPGPPSPYEIENSSDPTRSP